VYFVLLVDEKNHNEERTPKIASTGYFCLRTLAPAVEANQFGLLKKMILHAFLNHLGIDPLGSIELQHRIKSIEFKVIPMRS
jgi:hypothetical protein